MSTTKLYLLNVPLDNDYQHTLVFQDKSLQEEFFKSRIVKTFTDFNYQRKDEFIRVPDHFDNLLNCNYVMYQNSAFNNKWFYAFITDIKFVDNGRSDIFIETDVIQTWQFDYNVGISFVEREHVNDDSVGAHTIPENLQLGEYICNNMIQDDNLEKAPFVVMGSTSRLNSDGEIEKAVGGYHGGVFSGVRYYVYKFVDTSDGETEQYKHISDVLQDLTDGGSEDAVSSLFMAPRFLINETFNVEGDVISTPEPKSYTFTIQKPTRVDNYKPKNNKLLTYPFSYLMVSNGNGANAIYHYELFGFDTTETDLNFMVYGVLTPGCSIRMIPAFYKGAQTPESEGLNLGKFPQCNWATDQFTNWLTQNGVNIATSIISGVGSVAMGVGSGAMVGGIPGAIVGGITGAFSGGSSIASTLNEVYKAERVPPQAHGNLNCGDVVFAHGDNTFTYYQMSIKEEYAKIIDDYFDMYGYKVNALKVPNKWHRGNYWYTKLIDANIQGAIPKKDLNKIKQIYNTGITFWRSINTFRNYEEGNAILSGD